MPQWKAQISLRKRCKLCHWVILGTLGLRVGIRWGGGSSESHLAGIMNRLGPQRAGPPLDRAIRDLQQPVGGGLERAPKNGLEYVVGLGSVSRPEHPHVFLLPRPDLTQRTQKGPGEMVGITIVSPSPPSPRNKLHAGAGAAFNRITSCIDGMIRACACVPVRYTDNGL